MILHEFGDGGLGTYAINRVEEGTKVPLARDNGISTLNLCITIRSLTQHKLLLASIETSLPTM